MKIFAREAKIAAHDIHEGRVSILKGLAIFEEFTDDEVFLILSLSY